MNRRTGRARRRGVTGTISLGAGLGLVLTFMGLVPIPEVRWKLPMRETGEYRPDSRLRPGEELAIVFVGSSACAWSNRPELTTIVRGLKTTLAARAEAAGMGFAAVGVARDIVAESGIAHLEKFGRFDEVMSGRGWANTGIQKYLYDAMPGPGATPQILILARSLDYSTGHVTIVDERVLARKVGLKEITAWVDEGAPLAQRRGRPSSWE